MSAVEPLVVYIYNKTHPDLPKRLDERIFDFRRFDSLHLIEFIMQIEDEFGVSIHDNEIEGIQTLSDVINIVERSLYEGEEG